MKTYIVNGKPYEISLDQEEQFLKDVEEQGFTATLQQPIEVSQPQVNQEKLNTVFNLSDSSLGPQKTPEEAKEIVNSNNNVKNFYNWMDDKIDDVSWLSPGAAKIKAAKSASEVIRGVTKGLYNLATGETSKIENEEDRKLETYK